MRSAEHAAGSRQVAVGRWQEPLAKEPTANEKNAEYRIRNTEYGTTDAQSPVVNPKSKIRNPKSSRHPSSFILHPSSFILHPFVFVCMLAFLLLAALPAPASAAPKVMLYGIRMSAEPSIAGIDMPIVVAATVEFGGACCYTVYAHTVEARLNLTEGATLVAGPLVQYVTSPGETTPGRVAALPGGGLTKITLSWTIKCSSYGKQTMSLVVTGYSIRSPEPDESFEGSESLTVVIAPGASVSAPDFPHPPMVGRDTLVVVTVTPVAGSVRQVWLNYSFDNTTWFSSSMVRTSPEKDGWLGTIPKQTAETKVYFYMASLNSLNQSFTTGTYVVAIKDYSMINNVKALGLILLLGGTAAGVVLIMLLALRTRRRAYASRPRSGLFVPGRPEPVPTGGSTEGPGKLQLELARRRRTVMMVLVVIVIVLVVVAVLLGQFDYVFAKTTNPQGS